MRERWRGLIGAGAFIALVFVLLLLLVLLNSSCNCEGVGLLPTPTPQECDIFQVRACVVPPCTGPGMQPCIAHEDGTRSWGRCVGYQRPQELELCNGKDDDCDGKTDNDVPGVGIACNVLSTCGTGHWTCAGGRFTCTSTQQRSEEVCDGKDNDCDGFVDNIAPLRCYGGWVEGQGAAPATMGVGGCRAGTLRCVGDTTVCEGASYPQAPVCGQDADCDGKPDPVGDVGLDIVLFIDVSGSMDRLLQIQSILLQFLVAHRADLTVRAGLVIFPSPEDRCRRITPLLPLGQLAPFIETALVDNATADEPSLDCLYLALQPARYSYDGTLRDNPIPFEYHPGAHRMFVMVSDEIAQSYLTPELTPAVVLRELNAAGVRLHVVEALEAQDSFRGVISGGGEMLDIDQPWSMEPLFSRMPRDASCH